MSCIINKNKDEILECSTGLIEDLFYEFKNIIREDNLKAGKELEYFLLKLGETIVTHGGAHIDIAVIFNSSRNVNFVIKLLEKTIPKIQSGLREHAILSLWDFRDELIKYKKELESQQK